MDIILIIICLVGLLLVMEFFKHLLVKKSAKLITIFFIILIFFLLFSFAFKNSEVFEENKIIQTGATISDSINEIIKDKIDLNDFTNSTLKSNKLFKS